MADIQTIDVTSDFSENLTSGIVEETPVVSVPAVEGDTPVVEEGTFEESPASEDMLALVAQMALEGHQVEDIITAYGKAMGWTGTVINEKSAEFRENLGEFALAEGLVGGANEVKLLNYMTHHTLIDSVIKLGVIDLCQTRVEFEDTILAVSKGFAAVLASLQSANIVIEAPAASVSKPDAAVVIDGTNSEPLTQATTVSGKRITMKNVAVSVKDESFKKAVLTAKASEGNVSLSGVKLEGAIADKATVQGIIESNGEVLIKDCVFGMKGYNNINIGNSSLPSKITIENCDFTAPMTNNAISVYKTVDGCVIDVKNCVFHDCSNALRLFNMNNVNVTLNVENCTFKKWEEARPEYAGALILEDASSKSAEAEEANNLFAPEKVKVNFINCFGPHGKLEAKDISKVAGTKDEKQILYVYYHVQKDIPFGDGSKYPTVSFK